MPAKHEIPISEFMQRVLDLLPLKWDRIIKFEKYPNKKVYFLYLEKSEQVIPVVLKFSVPDKRVQWTKALKEIYASAGVQVLSGIQSKKGALKFTISYYKGYPIQEDLKVLCTTEQAETIGARFAYPQVKAWRMGVNLGDNPDNFVMSRRGVVPIDEGDLRQLNIPLEQLLLKSVILSENEKSMRTIRNRLAEDNFFSGMLRFEQSFKNEHLASAFFIGFFREAARLMQKKQI